MKDTVGKDNQLKGFRLGAINKSDAKNIVENFIGDNLSAGVTLYDFSKFLCLSERTVSRRLGSIQLSFRQINIAVKMNAAAKMLDETEFSIGLISKNLGYSDPSNFVKCFKNYYGCTPRNYRGKLRKSFYHKRDFPSQ